MFDFLNLGKSIQAIQTKHSALVQDLRQIQSEILTVSNARTNRKDVSATVETWVKESGAKFAPAMADRLLNTHTIGTFVAPYTPGFFGVVRQESGETNISTMDSCLCAVFPEQITAAIKGAIAQMPWPDEGLPKAERAAKIEKLRAREIEIRAQLTELQKNAEAAGIEL